VGEAQSTGTTCAVRYGTAVLLLGRLFEDAVMCLIIRDAYKYVTNICVNFSTL